MNASPKLMHALTSNWQHNGPSVPQNHLLLLLLRRVQCDARLACPWP